MGVRNSQECHFQRTASRISTFNEHTCTFLFIDYIHVMLHKHHNGQTSLWSCRSGDTSLTNMQQSHRYFAYRGIMVIW
jgi:hypothetical protein